MAAPAASLTSLNLSRQIKVSPKRIYTAFTQRDELNAWFCTNSFIEAQENGASSHAGTAPLRQFLPNRE